jgi:hypothetical protein
MQTPGRAQNFARPGCLLEGPFQNAGVFSAIPAGFRRPGRAQENKVANRLRLEKAFGSPVRAANAARTGVKINPRA